jgi:hypothetical protein
MVANKELSSTLHHHFVHVNDNFNYGVDMSLDWLIRFQFGLPCRQNDLEEIRQTLPELLNEEFGKPDFRRRQHFLPYRIVTESWDEMRDWTRDVQLNERNDRRAPLSSSCCPLDLCPLKTGQVVKQPGQSSSLRANDAGPNVLQLMTLGGMIGAREASAKRRDTKQPNDHLDSMSEFQKLLRKVHPEEEGRKVESIVITDPYLHMQFDDAKPYFLKYFASIRLPKGSKATVKISPRIKKASAGFKKIEEALKSEFQDVILAHHSPKRRFHDRFFLVQYGNGVARGVFGPSLNSLASNDVYLMGELEPHCIDALRVKEL